MNLETRDMNAKPEVLRRDERERKGAGFLPFLFSKLGLGGGGTGGLLGGAGGGGGLGWLGGFGGGLMASKAGMVALVLAGTTVAAGIGMFTSSGPRVVKRLQGDMSGLGFLPKAESEGSEDASAGADALAAQGGASQSLDYFSKANPPAVETAADQAVADAASSAPADQSAEVSQAPASDSHASPTFNAAASMPKPQLVRSQSSVNSASGGGGSGGFAQVSQAPHSGMAGNISGKSSGGSIRSMSPNTRMGMSGVGGGRAGGRSAAQQLAGTRRAVAGNLRSGQVSSPGSGTTYDGGLSPTGSAGPAAGKAGSGLSQGSGGDGLNTARSTSKDLKDISPPPPAAPEKKNQTPYQKQIYMAIGALAVGMIALMLATHFANKAKATPPPASAGLWTAAQVLAGVAAAAGAAAAVIGLTIMTKYKQQMQGIMFMASGGILSFQAGKALMDSFSDKEAQEKIAAKDVACQEAAKNALGVKPGDGTTLTKMGDGSYAKFGADGKMIGDPIKVSPTADGKFVSGNQLFDAKGNAIQAPKTDITPKGNGGNLPKVVKV